MKAIVHIGSPKAGSTSIQEFLFVNRDALAVQGFRYHRDIEERSSQLEYPLAAMARQGQLLWGEAQRITYNATTLDEQTKSSESHARNLLTYRRKWKEPVALFSSEHILPWLKSPDTIASLDRMFRDAFTDVRYVVYFRSPLDTVTSQYSERLKRGETSAPFSEFVDQRLDGLNIFGPANRWLKTVGKDRFDVRLLDEGFLKGGDLIDDYCHACGIDPTGLVRPLRQNEALSAPAAECMRILNGRIPKFDPDGADNPLRYELVETLVELSADSPKQVLRREQRKKVREATAASNERLRKVFFPEVKKLFCSSRSRQPALRDAELREMALHLMAELVIRLKLGRLPEMSPQQREQAFASAFEPPKAEPPPNNHEKRTLANT